MNTLNPELTKALVHKVCHRTLNMIRMVIILIMLIIVVMIVLDFIFYMTFKVLLIIKVLKKSERIFQPNFEQKFERKCWMLKIFNKFFEEVEQWKFEENVNIKAQNFGLIIINYACYVLLLL